MIADFEENYGCHLGTLRHAVAEFIDDSPLLNHYEGEKYFELEDAIVDFVNSLHEEQDKKLHFYEVGEEVKDGFEMESNVFIRTTSFEDAVEVFLREREKIKNDENFFIDKQFCSEDYIDYIIRKAHLCYEDIDDCKDYGLYLEEYEIETRAK